MRANRRVIAANYDEQSEGSEEDQEWAQGVTAVAAASRGRLAGSRGGEAPVRTAAAAAAGGSGSGSSHPPGLEDWEEAELALLSPESQKRERRRIANRDCARRIRQRKTELLAELTATMEQLQAENARLLATLTEVTRCWKDTTIENAELRAQVVLLQAGGSGGSRTSGGTGGGSGLPSPVELPQQLASPGWPSPMAL